MKRTFIAAAIVACIAGFASVGFSEGDPPKGAEGHDASAAPAMEMEKPSEQHMTMRRMVGEWECSMSMTMGPGQVVESKGTSTCRQFGEFWIIEDAKYDMMGHPFEGHGIYGYDAGQKKYMSTWVDTSASWGMNSEGHMDADGTLVTKSSGPDYMKPGAMTTYTMKENWPDNDTRVLRMFTPGPDGAEMEVWKLTAKRKK